MHNHGRGKLRHFPVVVVCTRVHEDPLVTPLSSPLLSSLNHGHYVPDFYFRAPHARNISPSLMMR
jgi:hypothetical protein